MSDNVGDGVPVIAVEDLASVHTVEEFDISPDGSQIAFAWNASGNWQIHTIPVTGGEPQQVTAGPEAKVFPRWSPDGRFLAYLQDVDGNENFDIYLHVPARKGSAAINLTDDAAHVYREIHWAPDSRRLVCASNRTGNFEVTLVEPERGQPEQLTAEDGPVTTPRWSPDSQWIAYAVRLLDREAHRFALKLVSADGMRLRPLGTFMGAAESASPRWSPDGRHIAFLSDEHSEYAQLAVMDVESETLRWLTHDMWGKEAIEWAPGGKRLVYVLNQGGEAVCRLLNISTGAELPVIIAAGRTHSPRWTPDGRALVVAHSGPRTPNDLWWIRLEDVANRQVTEGLVTGVDADHLVAPERIAYETFDGRGVPAFLYQPHNAPANGELPALLWVHGGPTAQYLNEWNPLIQLLVNRGYVVLAPNIRGSTGYGKSYRDMNLQDWGGGDLHDLVAGARYLSEQSLADPDHIGLIGASYGGYMTLMALSKEPDVWAAGASIVGIANLTTLWNTTRPGDLRSYLEQQLGGPPEENPALYEDRSPINFASQIRVPLLILQGRSDSRVSLGEAEQIRDALETQGTPYEFEVYAGEGHGFRKEENRIDSMKRILAFFDEHLK